MIVTDLSFHLGGLAEDLRVAEKQTFVWTAAIEKGVARELGLGRRGRRRPQLGRPRLVIEGQLALITRVLSGRPVLAQEGFHLLR